MGHYDEQRDEPILSAGISAQELAMMSPGMGSVDKGMIYAHTNYSDDPMRVGLTVGSPLISATESGTPPIEYKFNEGNLINQFRNYIDSTYDAHYCTSGIQSSEVIIDRGRGMGFFLGNVDKYSSRYGNKGEVADHRKDLMKVLHYALLALHTHDLEND